MCLLILVDNSASWEISHVSISAIKCVRDIFFFFMISIINIFAIYLNYVLNVIDFNHKILHHQGILRKTELLPLIRKQETR